MQVLRSLPLRWVERRRHGNLHLDNPPLLLPAGPHRYIL
jgi:hypothetical protein